MGRRTWLFGVALCTLLAAACAPQRGASPGGSQAEDPAAPPDPNTHVYLLFGQSNMWGVAPVEESDRTITPKVEVMAFKNCSGQKKDEWYPAAPPLHGCIGQGKGNPGLGPGDTFAKAVSEAHPEATILLVPGAIPGESINTFLPGTPAYESIVSRMKKAQLRGIVRGFLFHQGESDTGQEDWLERVNTVVTSLRTELAVPDVPFIAGELPYDGCCGAGHNPIIRQLRQHVENSHVVSAEGLNILGDRLHFDSEANRELGRRYAQALLPLLSE